MKLLSKSVKVVNGIIIVNQKNPIIVLGLGGDEAKFGHSSKGTSGLREGDEDVATKGQTHQSLPPPNGGVW